jgi:hypothetical protein
MDCQVCTISFEPHIAGIPGMAHLTLAFQKTRVVTQYHIKTVSQALERTLQRIHHACTNFVISYDLRHAQKSMAELAQAFAKLHREYAPQFERQLKAIALLVSDNLFTMPAKNGIRNFITGSCLPSCLRFIGHSKATAEDFFRALPCRTQPKGVESFASLVGADCDSYNNEECTTPCVGKMAPFQRQYDCTDLGIEVENAPMMQQLSNGDVRVVQTAATDVMLRQDPQSKICPERSTTPKDNSGDLQFLRTVKAFKFQCSIAKLQELIGTTFHIGELTIDADAASSILSGPTNKSAKVASRRSSDERKQCSSKLRSAAMFQDMQSTCSDGVTMLLAMLKTTLIKDAKETSQ